MLFGSLVEDKAIKHASLLKLLSLSEVNEKSD